MDTMISRVIRKTSAEAGGGSATGYSAAASGAPSAAKSDVRFNVPLYLAKQVLAARDYSASLVKKTPTLYLIAGAFASLPFLWIVPLVLLFVAPFWAGVGLFVYGAIVYDWTTTVNHVVVAAEEITGLSLRKSSSYGKPIYDLVISITLTIDQIIYRLNAPFRWATKFTLANIISPLVNIFFGPKGIAWPIVKFYYGIALFFWKYFMVVLKTAEKIGYSTVPTLTAYIVKIVEKGYYKAGDFASNFSEYVPLQLKQL